MSSDSRIKVRLPFRISDSDVVQLIHDCRMHHDCDLQITIIFPESTSGGGWITRPYSRGGPDLFIDITVPAEKKTELQESLRTILAVYGYEGSVEQLVESSCCPA